MHNKLVTNCLTSLWLLCAFFSYIQTISAQELSTPRITISTGEWAPLISESLSGYGPISTVVRESFLLSNIDIEFRFVPWKRAMREVDIGSSDASSAWRITNKRKQEFLFSDNVYENSNVFFYLKSNPFHWETFSDLKQYQIGAAIGYAYSEEFESAEKRGDFVVYRLNNEILLIDMLLKGRIQAFPANREVGLNLIRSKAPELFNSFAIHPKSLTKKPLRLIVKKNAKGQALLNKFNLGLKKLKSSGRFEEIYGKGPTP